MCTYVRSVFSFSVGCRLLDSIAHIYFPLIVVLGVMNLDGSFYRKTGCFCFLLIGSGRAIGLLMKIFMETFVLTKGCGLMFSDGIHIIWCYIRYIM